MTTATLVSLLVVKTLILSVGVLAACLLFRFVPIRSPGLCRLIWGGVLLLGVFGAGLPVTIPITEEQSQVQSAEFKVQSINHSELLTLNVEQATVPVFEQSIMPALDGVYASDFRETPIAESGIQSNNHFELCTLHSELSQYLYPALLFVWLTGIATLLTRRLVHYCRLLKHLKTARPVQGDDLLLWQTMLREHNIRSEKLALWTTSGIGPALVRTPRGTVVVVPNDLWQDTDERIKSGILRHELAHDRRHDLAVCGVVRWLTVLHWFNPLAWLAAAKFEEATEWACDVAAFGRDRDGELHFAESMIALHDVTPSISLNYFAFRGGKFRGGKLTRRAELLKMIITNPKESAMKKIVLTILVLSLLFAGMLHVRFVIRANKSEITLNKKEKITLNQVVEEKDEGTPVVIQGVVGAVTQISDNQQPSNVTPFNPRIVSQQPSNVNPPSNSVYSPKNIVKDGIEWTVSRNYKELEREGESLLHQAAESGDIETVKLLVSEGADVNAKGRYGYTPLYRAAAADKNGEVVEFLISHGADVHAVVDHFERRGDTPLHVAACENENVRVLELLVSAGADVNAESKNNWTPLRLAAATNENVEVTRYLVSQGANVIEKVKVIDDGMTIRPFGDDGTVTPLLYLAASGNKNGEVVKFLVSQGADVNAKNRFGDTPLTMVVARFEDIEVTKLLVSHGAVITDRTLEFAAARNKNVEVVKFLLSKVADVKDNNVNITVDGLLCAAGSNSNVEVARFFISQGANVNAKNDYLNHTPLHLAARENKNVEVAKYLVSEGADVNAKNAYYNIPLHEAALGGNVEVAKFLVSEGVDVNAKNYKNNTPLHEAISRENVEVAKFLIEEGADMKAKNNALFVAARAYKGALEMTQFLISHGVDVNVKMDDGWTPLHAAAGGREASLEVVQLLISHGADVNAKSNDGRTPLGSTLFGRHIRIAQLLISNGADVNVKNQNGDTLLHQLAIDSFSIRGDSGIKLEVDEVDGVKVVRHITDLDVARFLISQGADVNAKNNNGDTPLHITVSRYRTITQMTRLFIFEGADINMKNKNGESPLDMAKKNWGVETAEYEFGIK